MSSALCVMAYEDRPTMASVLLMLDSESAVLPLPKRPGYYTERFLDESSAGCFRFSTVNDLTDTIMQGR
ncbi:hypothetical protein Leryth_025976 [Lithospermum erythrorhizon]|nr:hypothetical protein Leryth_025976 [Lithospermum erythrorhizon]